MTFFAAPLIAIFRNEVRLNAKRIAPYFMALLCAGNGLLWWGWGPATGRGWAVNSDFFISSALPVYSFMTLPLFTALFMADPVIKDFRYGIDPLIFSKPISRAQYLLGKFFGYSDLAGPNRLRILMHRGYTLALAGGFITVAHLANARRTLRMHSRLPG